MTPSEIAEELERATIFNQNSLLSEAAATIRAQAEALKIATEALELVSSNNISSSPLNRHERSVRYAAQALARIKEV